VNGTDELADARADLIARQGTGARYDAAAAPAAELALARLGTAYFARKLNELSDRALDGPSGRSGWSRRRVIAAIGLQAREIAQAIADAAGLVSDEREPTDAEALDLAETLPPRALRHLVAHADIHLNVVWRDLGDAAWHLPLQVGEVEMVVDRTPALRAVSLWTAAMDLGNGARMADVPPSLMGVVAANIDTSFRRNPA
jgi:maleylpyruvate isomerase